MNHTHYALINEDNDVVAVIRRPYLDEYLSDAIAEETGERVVNYELQETDFFNYKVTADLESGFRYTATLRPTWEY
jgi:hypothetical protein